MTPLRLRNMSVTAKAGAHSYNNKNEEKKMKKKTAKIGMACILSLSLLGGCATTGQEAESVETQAVAVDNQITENVDQAAANQAAELIDAIYVQKRTDQTDEQCKAAKEAWDALTDAQKQLVQGENADPDYFGRDTGNASLDNPLNQDEIGENELLVVSFGTSFNDSRATDVDGIEKALQEAYKDWSVRRAFTAQIIINHVQARDGEKIDNMEQALERAVNNGVKNLIIQPTHLMYGAEYDELVEEAANYQDKFETIKIAEPLLGEVGSDATIINADKEAVAKAITQEAVKVAGFDSIEAAEEAGAAFVFMGHGTSHTANVTYNQMQTQMDILGYQNVFIGTVEGEPEDTACDVVMEKVKEAGYKTVILRPLMIVAGDHANNDMAGEDEDSWKSQFESSGFFDSVIAQLEGLGRIAEIQSLCVAHTQAAMETAGILVSNSNATGEILADGEYSVTFDTDSSMFRVNEAKDGKGELTVKEGVMTLHISLPSKSIVNLYVGLADDAKKNDAELLSPTIDTVTYSDGISEEVHGFDIPVSALGEEFDLALIGTKGTWYDHKVSVSNPQKILTDGVYTVQVALEGGSGKSTVESPAQLEVRDGQIFATVVWSSSNYDYMIVNEEKYLNESTDGNSTFTFPISGVGIEIPVIGNTIAMGTPHEIEYTLCFDMNE